MANVIWLNETQANEVISELIQASNLEDINEMRRRLHLHIKYLVDLLEVELRRNETLRRKALRNIVDEYAGRRHKPSYKK